MREVSSSNDEETGVTVNGIAAMVVDDQFAANHVPLEIGENTIPGIYFVAAEVADAQGNTYQDAVAIMAMSVDELDARLQAKWAGMKTALTTGDIDKALTFHHQRYREQYAAIYQALGDNLPALTGQMSDISWICYMDGVAKYRIRQTHDVNGQPVTITYYIYIQS
jgi:hypothetical protein